MDHTITDLNPQVNSLQGQRDSTRLLGQRVSTPRPSLTTRYGAAALDSTIDRLQQTIEGHRHRDLFVASLGIGSLTAGGELHEGYAHSQLVEIGLVLGLARADVERQVTRGLTLGQANPRSAPRKETLDGAADARVRTLAWWDAIASDPALRTRTGTTTLKILAGFALLAMHAGKVKLSESYRQVAEAAGVSPGTVVKHRAALAPYVRQVIVHRRTECKGTEWQLVVRRGHLETALRSREVTPQVLFPNGHPLGDPSANVWHRRSGWWAAWSMLDEDEGLTVAELGAAIGRQPRTVRRILGWMAAEGLVVAVEGRWCRQEAAVAPVVEVDHAEARKARHAAERDAWRRHLAARVAAKEAERERMSTMSPEELRRYRAQVGAKRLRQRAQRYENGRARRAGQALPLLDVEAVG
jgi:hypothetical protein